MDDFTCAICLDVLYKPCVNTCGHVFCFWCTHRCMFIRASQSNCPYCRQKIYRLPAVCEALHNHVKHAFPEDYARRAAAITAEEESQGYGSFPVDDVWYSEKKESGESARRRCALYQEFYRELLSCVSCRRVASSPLVLSCGHLICSPTCCQPSCRKCNLRSAGPPSKCPKLKELVSQTIPELVVATMVPEEIGGAEPSGTGRTNEPGSGIELVHLMVGCDECGKMPIRGRRFTCRDCPTIGYDLCGDCYEHHRRGQPCSKNRFNQDHRPSHRLVEVIPPPSLRVFAYIRPETDSNEPEEYFMVSEAAHHPLGEIEWPETAESPPRDPDNSAEGSDGQVGEAAHHRLEDLQDIDQDPLGEVGDEEEADDEENASPPAQPAPTIQAVQQLMESLGIAHYADPRMMSELAMAWEQGGYGSPGGLAEEAVETLSMREGSGSELGGGASDVDSEEAPEGSSREGRSEGGLAERFEAAWGESFDDEERRGLSMGEEGLEEAWEADTVEDLFEDVGEECFGEAHMGEDGSGFAEAWEDAVEEF